MRASGGLEVLRVPLQRLVHRAQRGLARMQGLRRPAALRDLVPCLREGIGDGGGGDVEERDREDQDHEVRDDGARKSRLDRTDESLVGGPATCDRHCRAERRERESGRAPQQQGGEEDDEQVPPEGDLPHGTDREPARGEGQPHATDEHHARRGQAAGPVEHERGPEHSEMGECYGHALVWRAGVRADAPEDDSAHSTENDHVELTGPLDALVVDEPGAGQPGAQALHGGEMLPASAGAGP
jgi:hypothetical protein